MAAAPTGAMGDEPRPRRARSAEPAARVVLGRVVGAHGLRGELRIRWLGDGPDHLLAARALFLGAGPDDPAARRCAVRAAGAGRGGEVRVALEGVTSREAADALRGLHVLAEASALEPLPEGEHYWFELIGCRVEDQHGTPIGTVTEIWETGAHDVLVVDGEDGRRRLVPAASELMEEVDIEARRIAIQAIPGLLDPV